MCTAPESNSVDSCINRGRTSPTRRVPLLIAALATLVLLTAGPNSEAQVASPQMMEFVFVKFGGRPGHQSFAPMQGVPAPGQTANIRVQISGSVLSARAEITNLSGNTIDVVQLTRPAGSALDTPVFYGNLIVPSEPFKVLAKGQLNSGALFVSKLGSDPSIVPQTLQLEITPLEGLLLPSTPAKFYARIVNYGASDTFTLTANSSPLTGIGLSANSIPLASGQSATVELSTITPLPSQFASPLTLTITAVGRLFGAQSTIHSVSRIADRLGQTLLADVRKDCFSRNRSDESNKTVVVIRASGAFNLADIDPNSIYIAGNLPPMRLIDKDARSGDDDCGDAVEGKNALSVVFNTRNLLNAVKTLLPNVAVARGATVSIPISARTKGGVECRGFVRLAIEE